MEQEEDCVIVGARKQPTPDPSKLTETSQKDHQSESMGLQFIFPFDRVQPTPKKYDKKQIKKKFRDVLEESGIGKVQSNLIIEKYSEDALSSSLRPDKTEWRKINVYDLETDKIKPLDTLLKSSMNLKEELKKPINGALFEQVRKSMLLSHNEKTINEEPEPKQLKPKKPAKKSNATIEKAKPQESIEKKVTPPEANSAGKENREKKERFTRSQSEAPPVRSGPTERPKPPPIAPAKNLNEAINNVPSKNLNEAINNAFEKSKTQNSKVTPTETTSKIVEKKTTNLFDMEEEEGEAPSVVEDVDQSRNFGNRKNKKTKSGYLDDKEDDDDYIVTFTQRRDNASPSPEIIKPETSQDFIYRDRSRSKSEAPERSERIRSKSEAPERSYGRSSERVMSPDFRGPGFERRFRENQDMKFGHHADKRQDSDYRSDFSRDFREKRRFLDSKRSEDSYRSNDYHQNRERDYRRSHYESDYKRDFDRRSDPSGYHERDSGDKRVNYDRERRPDATFNANRRLFEDGSEYKSRQSDYQRYQDDRDLRDYKAESFREYDRHRKYTPDRRNDAFNYGSNQNYNYHHGDRQESYPRQFGQARINEREYRRDKEFIPEYQREQDRKPEYSANENYQGYNSKRNFETSTNRSPLPFERLQSQSYKQPNYGSRDGKRSVPSFSNERVEIHENAPKHLQFNLAREKHEPNSLRGPFREAFTPNSTLTPKPPIPTPQIPFSKPPIPSSRPPIPTTRPPIPTGRSFPQANIIPDNQYLYKSPHYETKKLPPTINSLTPHNLKGSSVSKNQFNFRGDGFNQSPFPFSNNSLPLRHDPPLLNSGMGLMVNSMPIGNLAPPAKANIRTHQGEEINIKRTFYTSQQNYYEKEPNKYRKQR